RRKILSNCSICDCRHRFREIEARSHEFTFEEINKFSLSTVSADGRPSSRIMLLQSHDDAGFTFTKNDCSRKVDLEWNCIQLATNPHASLLFYWPAAESPGSRGGCHRSDSGGTGRGHLE
ncbi:hypothetical protein PENTCL1PPCAC_8108, partial [Pristionchus entomophagus]